VVSRRRGSKKRRSHEVLFESVAISIKRPIDNVREEAANPLLFKIRASWSRTALPGKALGMGLVEVLLASLQASETLQLKTCESSTLHSFSVRSDQSRPN
jgi:hypothetical protein